MNEDTELIIHVGTHKTGTTSIQKYLESHKHELTSADHINFLDFNIPKKFKLPFTDQYDQNLVQEIKSYLKQNVVAGKRNLISHEGFFGNPMEFYSNYKTTAEILHSSTSEYNTKIVVLFRRQDLFIQSCFLQYKSRGHRFTFSEFYDREKMKNLTWFAMANYYEELFGRDHLRIQLYDPKQFTEKNLLHIFGEMIGSEKMQHMKNVYTQNVGFSNQTVEVFDKVSKFLTDDERLILKSVLEKNFNRGTGTHYDFLDPEEVNYIYDFFLKSNQKLTDRYCTGQSFSDVNQLFGKPKTHKKYKIYLHIISEILGKKSPLSSTKKAMLKSYLYSTKSALLKDIPKRLKNIS